MKISLIIPMYNEEEIAGATIGELCAYLSELTDEHSGYFADDWELILSDDGSVDRTRSIADKAAADNVHIKSVGTVKNHGKGSAVRTGFAASTGDAVVFTDCDLAYGTEPIGKIAAMLFDGEGYDVVIGSRALHPEGYAGYSFARKLMSKCYLGYVSFVAGFKHSDSQTGIKAFRGDAGRAVFARCEVDRFAFDLEALLIAEKFGYSVGEMPVSISRVRESRSRVRPIKDAVRMTRDIGMMKKRIKIMEK